MPIISDFLSKVQSVYKTGAATEHSYRPALEGLFNSLDENVRALNEPKRVECGAPDFIIQRGEIVIGHVEAKDLNIGLRSMKDANKSQQDRYRKALPNLIYTNCLDWDFYRDGNLIASVTIADYLLGIQPSQANSRRWRTCSRTSSRSARKPSPHHACSPKSWRARQD